MTALNALSSASISPALAFLVEYLDLAEATGDPDARWETYQFHFLNNSRLLAIWKKSRQVGWSWTAAADAVAHGKLYPRTPSIFVSINLEEAAEKVRYAKQIIDALDDDVRPTLITDNRFELEFENGSRLISHPCRPVRGKARGRVYLDEFAHYPKDVEIYTSALPVISRGGQIYIGSSPLGAKGRFWEIYDQKIQPYPGYKRRPVPWWLVSGLCKDVESARKFAPHMLTEERVKLFGTARLLQIFENLPLEDFQQEYELAWVDEATAWITWEEIKRNQVLDQSGRLWHRHLSVQGERGDAVSQVFQLIDQVADAVREGHIEQALAAGFDVGRKRNLSELTFVGKTTTGQYPYRLGIGLHNMEFDDQRTIASRCLDMLPVTSLLIDRNGLGMQLAEQLSLIHGARAQGVDFTNPSKELWSVDIKVQMQKANVPLPLDRDLAYQIHSIKRKITMAKHSVFDTEGNEKHHADRYWSLALAVWAAGRGEVEAVWGENPLADVR